MTKSRNQTTVSMALRLHNLTAVVGSKPKGWLQNEHHHSASFVFFLCSRWLRNVSFLEQLFSMKLVSCGQVGISLFSQVTRDRMRGNDLNMCQGRFELGINNNFLHQKGCEPGAAVKSLFLNELKAVWLWHMGTWVGGGPGSAGEWLTRWSQSSSPIERILWLLLSLWACSLHSTLNFWTFPIYSPDTLADPSPVNLMLLKGCRLIAQETKACCYKQVITQ